VMGRANASTKRKREAIAFVKERYMAMVALERKIREKWFSLLEYDLRRGACIMYI
jgi:hypothetical protein